jgi:hypothetical protein
MANHPNRAVARAIRQLSPETLALVNDYVDWVFAECMGEDETWALGTAWRETTIWAERSHLAAAMVYRSHALADAPYRILEERGRYADARLCAIADDLRLA